MAEPTIALVEKLERMTIDEVGKVVPASPQKADPKEEISWSVWCEVCSKKIEDDLSSTDHARTIGEIHRSWNPGHPEKCIIIMVHVDYTEEMFRL